MFKEKRVEDKVEEVISYSEKKGYRENIVKNIVKEERRALTSAESRSLGIFGDIYRGRADFFDDYESELFSQSSWDDHIEKDYLTGEPIIMSYETWIENTLKIVYQYKGQKYEKIIKRESHKNPYKVGQKLYVSFRTDSPDTIIDIDDKYISTGLMMMMLFSVLIFEMVLLTLFYII